MENNENIGGSRISREGDAATTTIECTTLDDWVAENNIPRIDFIKADIEGTERDIILSIDPSYHIDQRAKKLYAW